MEIDVPLTIKKQSKKVNIVALLQLKKLLLSRQECCRLITKPLGCINAAYLKAEF